MALATIAVALLGFLGWRFVAMNRAATTRRDVVADKAVSVTSAAVETGDLDLTIEALGSVAPLTTVTVKTQISGQLTEVAFKEGQLVHAGDFLAQIDPRPHQLALEQYEGQRKRDQALLDEALLDLARYETLLAQDSIAKQQVTTERSLVHQYEGTIETDKALVDTAKLDLTYCHIVSPLSGRVGLRQVDPGNYVQTGDAGGIATITQMQPISVLFALPEDELPAVVERFHSGATLPVTAFDRAHVVRLAFGTLQTIDNQIDTNTGTVKLRALFANDDEKLFPNQFVNVQLVVDTLKGKTIAPTAAIQRGPPGTFVYLVKDDLQVSVRAVKLGPSFAGRVVVESGLASRDLVVVDGADKLREGTRVALARPRDAEPVESSR